MRGLPPRSTRKGPLAQRYGTADLAVLDPEEKQRFLGAACADPSTTVKACIQGLGVISLSGNLVQLP